MCWIDIQDFKSIPVESYRRSKALHIYHKYIKTNAILQIKDIPEADRAIPEADIRFPIAIISSITITITCSVISIGFSTIRTEASIGGLIAIIYCQGDKVMMMEADVMLIMNVKTDYCDIN